jgi:hypothetical protein
MSEYNFDRVAHNQLAAHRLKRDGYRREIQTSVGSKRKSLAEQIGSKKAARSSASETASAAYEMIGSLHDGKTTGRTNIGDKIEAEWRHRELNMKTLRLLARASLKRGESAVHPFPFSFILARPRMTYDMGTAVLMKGGSDTGNTFVGFNDFQLGDDIVTKMHHGHYTYYSKAVVKNEKNIMIAHNVFASAYHGGNASLFATTRADLDARNGGNLNDTIVMLAPRDEVENKSNPLHIFDNNSDHTERHQFTNADTYKDMFRWNRDLGDDAFATEAPEDGNDLCFRGHQIAFEGTNGNGGFRKVTRNTGHWGDTVYPGCASVRNGQMKYFTDPRFR